MTPATGRRGLQRPWATEEGVTAGPPLASSAPPWWCCLGPSVCAHGHGAAAAPGRAGGGAASYVGAEGQGGLEPGTAMCAPLGVPHPGCSPGMLLPVGQSGGSSPRALICVPQQGSGQVLLVLAGVKDRAVAGRAGGGPQPQVGAGTATEPLTKAQRVGGDQGKLAGGAASLGALGRAGDCPQCPQAQLHIEEKKAGSPWCEAAAGPARAAAQ